MRKWLGRLVVIRREGDPHYKPQRVRITATEAATPFHDSRNPSGFWFWAVYE